MADDDEARDEPPLDPTFASAGPRRSTFTPPPASAQEPVATPEPAPAAEHDDDALADALAADLGRLASGPIPVVDPANPFGAVYEPTLPAAHGAGPAPETAPHPVVDSTPAWQSPETPVTPEPLTPAWSSLPAPDPAQAVPLEEAPPPRPADDQLTQWAEQVGLQPGGSTLDMIQQLENQMRLRQQGAASDSAAPQTGSFVVPGTPMEHWPAPDSADVVPTVEAPPLPAWDVPAPSASWSPEPDEAVIVPEIDPDPEPVLEDPAPQPEIEVEVEPEPEPEPESFFPPELVEPDKFSPPASTPPLTFEQALRMPEPAAVVETQPAPTFAFDEVLAGPTGPTESANAVETLFIEPLPVAAGEPVPTDTGSISVVDQAYEEELDDDVDDTDRVFGGLGPVSVDALGTAFPAAPPAPPSGPIATVRIPEDESVLYDDEPIRQKVFSLETSGVEATPVDHRVGHSARLFWLWFAANSSILGLGVGAAVFAVGLSLRQSIVAVLAGVALSFIPLGLSTLAGKRSGQPTMVVSRATFGLIGNVIPALLALVTRVFWGAVLLWLLASSVAIVLVGAGADGALGERLLLLVSLAGAFVVALLVAFAGYPLFARIQLILTCVSAVLVVGLVVLTARYIDIPQALTTPDGPWLLTISGAVLVFSVVGLVWAYSGADLARYQRVGTSGAASMLWATFGSALPTFLIIAYGALLAASDPAIAAGFLISPLDTLAGMLPLWYPAPLLAAAALSLLSGIALSLYSGGFALQSLGVRLERPWSVLVVGVLLGGLAVLLTFGVGGGLTTILRDLATTLAVPTAAWAGLFAADTMIRARRYEGQSLVTRGGVYPDVRWVNVVALLVISAVGFSLTTATVTWLSWQGYAFPLLGIATDSDLASTDLGVLVALALGLLVPIATGIPAVRKQEATRL